MKQSFLFALSFILFMACQKSDDSPGNSSFLIPLKVGNSWIYINQVYRPDGSLNSSDEITFSISSDTLINGEERYKGFLGDSENFYRSTSTAVYQYRPFDNKEHLYFGTTAKQSELISQDTLGGTITQYIAFAALQSINNYSELMQNTDSSINATSHKVVNYNNVYLKPGIGIVEEDGYLTINLSGDGGGPPFSLYTKLLLKSYSFK